MAVLNVSLFDFYQSQLLFGRWQIDRENAFLADDYGLEGAFEVARLTKRPVQQAVRTSTGAGISAMEVATAYSRCEGHLKWILNFDRKRTS